MRARHQEAKATASQPHATKPALLPYPAEYIRLSLPVSQQSKPRSQPGLRPVCQKTWPCSKHVRENLATQQTCQHHARAAMKTGQVQFPACEVQTPQAPISTPVQAPSATSRQPHCHVSGFQDFSAAGALSSSMLPAPSPCQRPVI